MWTQVDIHALALVAQAESFADSRQMCRHPKPNIVSTYRSCAENNSHAMSAEQQGACVDKKLVCGPFVVVGVLPIKLKLFWRVW